MHKADSVSRLFAAIPITAAFKERANAFRQLCGELQGVRWIAEANLHVTLYFMGDVSDGAAIQVMTQLKYTAAEVTPFELTFEKFTAAGNPIRPSMIWGRFYRHAEFTALANLIAKAADPFILSPAVRFTEPVPHVTLARTSRHSVFKELPELTGIELSLPVDRICLWKTHRYPGGVQYEQLGEWAFEQ